MRPLALAALSLVIAAGASGGAPPPLRVEGTSTCPTPVEVSAKLEGLIVEAAGAEPHVAVVERRGPALHLELRDAAGAVLAQRDVTDRSPCRDLASVAAVIIAAWEAELRGSSAVLPPAPVVPKLPRRVAWDVGAAGSATYAGAWGWAPGGLALFSLGVEGGWLRGELVVSGAAPRPIAVGRGSATWFRVGAGLGPRVRLGTGRLGLDLHAQLFVAALSVRGAGFNENLSALDVDPAVLAGARGWYRLGDFRLFVGATFQAWLREQLVRVEQAGTPANPLDTGHLPRFELVLAAGVLFGS